MKKSLIALAVAGAFAAPAQAVEVNGAMAVGVDFSKASASTAGNSSISTHGVNSGYSNISLGHSEDLGDGMKMDVFLQAEWKPDNGTTNGSIDNRNSYIGLSGGFGAIRLGTNENAYERMLYSHNYMDGDWSYGNIGIMGRQSGQGPETSVWNRTPDTIMYYSPNMNGLSFEIDYVTPSTGKTATTSPNIISAALEFAPTEGNFRVYGAMHNSSDLNGNGSSEGHVLVGGGMTMGNIKWDVLVENVKTKNAGGQEFKHTSIDGEVQIGLPTGNLGLSIVKADKISGPGGDIADSGAMSISGEYMHNMGKSSWLFLVVSNVKNDANVDYNLGVFKATTAGGNGSDYTNFVVGLKHAF